MDDWKDECLLLGYKFGRTRNILILDLTSSSSAHKSSRSPKGTMVVAGVYNLSKAWNQREGFWY